MNNAEFIDGLHKQDAAAAKHLNECFVPSIWRFVYFRVDGDSHLAEDIVSEAVLALVSAAASETPIEHPGAWLRTVASRRIQDHFRAAARVQHLVEQAQQHVRDTDPQDPAKKHDQNLRRQSVRDAMDELPENYRIALEWKYVERLSVKLIAERLETSEKSAESILFRARNALRHQLKGERPEPPREDSRTSEHDATARNETNEKPSAGQKDADASVRKRPSAFLASRLAGES